MLDYNKHCNTESRAYYQVHEDKLPKNSLHPRNIGAIALGCTYNIQNGYA